MRGCFVLAVLMVVAAAARDAGAHPYAVEVIGGPRFTMTHDGMLARGALAGSRSWQDRWHTGVRAGLDASEQTTIYQASGELGIWLHASEKLDVVLGWRIGFARFHFRSSVIDAASFEPLAVFAFELSPRIELRLAPFVPAAYLSGLWQVTFGADLGVAWRL